MDLLQKMFLLSDNFDKGLVALLRIIVANYIKTHKELQINGLPIEFAIQEKYKGLEGYVRDKVLKMGEEAEDLILQLTAVALRIPICTILVSRNAKDGILRNTFTCDLYQEEEAVADEEQQQPNSLNFEGEMLSILLKPGHYDTLYHDKKFIQRIWKLSSIKFPLQSDMQGYLPEKGPQVSLEEELKAQFEKEVKYQRQLKEEEKRAKMEEELKESISLQCEKGHSCSLGKLKNYLETEFAVNQKGWKGMFKIDCKQAPQKLESGIKVVKPECTFCRKELPLGTLLLIAQKLKLGFVNHEALIKQINSLEETVSVALPCCGQRVTKLQLKVQQKRMLERLKAVQYQVNNFKLDLPACDLCHRVLNEVNLEKYLSPPYTPQEIQEIIQSKLPTCCICKRKRDADGLATFIHEEHGNPIHQSCADKIKLIKLECGHCFEREELKNSIYNTFKSLKPEILFQRARLKIIRPLCSKCDKNIALGVLQKIFANLLDVKEMADRIKNLQQSMPDCIICKTYIDQAPLEQRMINGFKNVVHPKCFEQRSYSLSCGHVHTLQGLRHSLQQNFSGYKTWSDLMKKISKQQDPEREDKISIPCCHECWKPLQYEELQQVLEGRMKLSKKDYVKLTKEVQEINCSACHQVVDKTMAVKMNKDLFVNEECFKSLIKMDCCKEYLRMEEIKQGLLGAEPENYEDLFWYDSEIKDVTTIRCPNCKKQITVKVIEKIWGYKISAKDIKRLRQQINSEKGYNKKKKKSKKQARKSQEESKSEDEPNETTSSNESGKSLKQTSEEIKIEQKRKDVKELTEKNKFKQEESKKEQVIENTDQNLKNQSLGLKPKKEQLMDSQDNKMKQRMEKEIENKLNSNSQNLKQSQFEDDQLNFSPLSNKYNIAKKAELKKKKSQNESIRSPRDDSEEEQKTGIFCALCKRKLDTPVKIGKYQIHQRCKETKKIYIQSCGHEASLQEFSKQYARFNKTENYSQGAQLSCPQCKQKIKEEEVGIILTCFRYMNIKTKQPKQEKEETKKVESVTKSKTINAVELSTKKWPVCKSCHSKQKQYQILASLGLHSCQPTALFKADLHKALKCMTCWHSLLNCKCKDKPILICSRGKNHTLNVNPKNISCSDCNCCLYKLK